MRNILFRADSSSFIGTGHIMRDLVLAKQYKTENIIFAVRELDGNINYKIDEDGYSKVVLKTNDFEELDKIIKKLNIDLIIIDHYEINYDFEKKLKQTNPNSKIFVLDDTYEKHFCDILLNHNISADEKKYENLVPNNCELRCGSKYTLIREEFILEKEKPKAINQKFIIFVAMGGSDSTNLNLKILNLLSRYSGNIFVNIVTTRANKNLTELIKYCSDKSWIILDIDSNKIAKIIHRSDLAIVTPSVILNEVYFMDIPFIAIKVADNQDDMYKFLKNKNYNVMEYFSITKLTKILNKILGATNEF